jgi:hypothetical protein
MPVRSYESCNRNGGTRYRQCITGRDKLSDICSALFGLALEKPHVVGGYLSMLAGSSIRDISREYMNSFENAVWRYRYGG